MNPPAFIDTNILVYVYDTRDAGKQKLAGALLDSLVANENGVISTQVVQEFCNVAINKIGQIDTAGLKQTLARVIMPLVGHSPSEGFYRRAIDLHAAHSLNFYDALIVQAALDLDCRILYSEDMQDGRRFGSLTVKDPFK